MRKGLLILFFVILTIALAPQASAEKLFFNARSQNGCLIVSASGEDKDTFALSINGGESFIPMKGKSITLTSLPEGDYQLCVMKNNDTKTVSDIQAVHLGSNYSNDNAELGFVCEGIREESFRSGKVKFTFNNKESRKKYRVSINGGHTWRNAENGVVEYTGLMSGYYRAIICSYGEKPMVSQSILVYVPPRIPAERCIMRIPVTYQLPELPTGCEVTSLSMAINYYGIKANKLALADCFLEKAEYRTADFRTKFVGDPRKKQSYGCYAGVIVKCAEKFLASVSDREFEVVDLTGCSLDRLFGYIDMGYPVIVWGTMGMVEPIKGASWLDRETGKVVTWVGNEHCMLLTGYDLARKCVFVNDPLYGVVSYDTELFEKRFNQLESQAVMIVETTKK